MRGMRWLICLAVILSVALWGVFLGIESVVGQPKDSMRVGWLRLACTAQSFVSKGAGILDQEALAVEHPMFNAGAETIEALSAGSLDASYLGVTPALAAISRGVPVKILAGGHRHGMGLVTRADSPIKSVKDLKGKTVATLGRGSLPDMQLRVTAKEHGLDPDKDFNLVTLPSFEAVTALERGGVHAMMNCPEWPQVALTSIKGARWIVTDLDGSLWHGKETQCVVVIVTDKFVKENPRATKKLLRAHVKATRTMINNPKEAAQIISQFEGAPYDGTALALSHMYSSPVPSVSSIEKWRDKMLEFGYIKRKVKIAELVDLGLLREVLVELGEKGWLSDLDQQMRLLEEIKKKEA